MRMGAYNGRCNQLLGNIQRMDIECTLLVWLHLRILDEGMWICCCLLMSVVLALPRATLTAWSYTHIFGLGS